MVINACQGVSKFSLGDVPALLAITGSSSSLYLILKANSSIPRSMKMKIMISIKTLNVLSAIILIAIAFSNILNCFQPLANLKTLSNLKPLKAEKAPKLPPNPVVINTNSTSDSITITASNLLKLSLMYSLKPSPNNFITISQTKAQVKISFITS